jgi:hypothetical protein
MQNRSQIEAEAQGYQVEYDNHQFNDGSHLTICKLLQKGVTIAIGIAICSPRDTYDRKLGNIISCGRALKAIQTLQFGGCPMALYRDVDNWAYNYANQYYGAKSIMCGSKTEAMGE